MIEVADGVWMLRLQRGFLNVYLVDDVLIDAGMPWSAGAIVRGLDGHAVGAHAITHAHPDHMGSSDTMCRRFGVPFWAGERDVAVAEDPGKMARDFVPLPRTPISDAFMRLTSGPGHRVDRPLRAGDAVGSFTVVDTPGHTRGHISLWREDDGVLIVGDALWNLPRLRPPLAAVNTDNRQLRESVRAIAALRPAVACFGHGPVLRDPDAIERVAAAL